MTSTRKMPMRHPIPYLRPNLIHGASTYTPAPLEITRGGIWGVGHGFMPSCVVMREETAQLFMTESGKGMVK
jgi:hypothetical protein